MTYVLKPHSPEWFAALEGTNPAQAAQTRRILSLAKRDDVCSICGDHSAADYELAGKSEQPTTLRLCDDCRGIRQNAYGEKFSPLRG